MVAALLIGLREGLEAALVVGILVAYLVKLDRRDALPKLWAGVGIAVLISLVAGGILTFFTNGLSSQTEEIIAGVLSIIAVGLITWMIFWMAKTAHTLKGELHESVDRSLVAGGFALAVIAMVAVGREGLETMLFIWSTVQAAGETLMPLLGAVIGIGLAVALGYGIYRGMLRVNLGKFFFWTGIMLIIVSAGVLSYGVHELQEAGVLPVLTMVAFDVSAVIPEDSWYGTLLKGIFNFSPVTTVLQFIVWWAYLITTLIIFLAMSRRRRPAQPSSVSASTVSDEATAAEATRQPATI